MFGILIFDIWYLTFWKLSRSNDHISNFSNFNFSPDFQQKIACLSSLRQWGLLFGKSLGEKWCKKPKTLLGGFPQVKVKKWVCSLKTWNFCYFSPNVIYEIKAKPNTTFLPKSSIKWGRKLKKQKTPMPILHWRKTHGAMYYGKVITLVKNPTLEIVFSVNFHRKCINFCMKFS